MGGWKRLIMGEKMPDKNDPKYKERYEKEVEAGRKTARFLKLDKAAAAIQRFADYRPRFFLSLVFGVVIFCFTYNVWCVYRVLYAPKHRETATQVQERKIEQRRGEKLLYPIPRDTDDAIDADEHTIPTINNELNINENEH